MSAFTNDLIEVDTLQARMLAYYTFYQQNKLQEDTTEDMNQFLAVTTDKQSTDRDFEQYEQSLFGSNKPTAREIVAQKILEDESQSESIYESHLLNNRQDVGLSRVFGDIVLGDQINNNEIPFDIQVSYDNNIFEIELAKRDEYSLSNFSSFNNQADIQLDFRQLIQKIESVVGRKLSRAGVDKIIGQIREGSLNFGEPEESSIRINKMSQLSDASLLHQLEDRHQYDNKLNFQRNKHKKTTENSIKGEDDWMEGKDIEDKSRKLQGKVKHKEEKQNRIEERAPRLGPQKSLRLTRKGKDTTIHYRDTRQVQQFCITNKIFGKEKDKLMRAINTDKSHLVLQ